MSRYDVSRDELAFLLADEPRYRVTQVWEGLYRSCASFEEMTALPAGLRERLAAEPSLEPAFGVLAETESDGGATIKWLLEAGDGARIETVVMRYPSRTTVCVSSQVGCAMGCSFCATGQLGFGRHLTKGELLEQVVLAARRAASMSWGRLGNVVFMGMGEPFANAGRVFSALDALHEDLHIGARGVTVSTVGVVPGILRMARERRQENLAVSLHAANDELRNRLVPLNRRYPLSELAEACRTYVEATHRRLSIEWALIDNVNDTAADAAELAAFARPLRAHVNVIPLNPTPGYGAAATPPERVASFRRGLTALGVNVTVRDTRGREQDAACGQLAAGLPLGSLAAPGRSRAARVAAGRHPA